MARPALGPALTAYVAAFAGNFAANVALIFAVGAARARAHGTATLDETRSYALSPGGLMTQAIVSACVLATVAVAAARTATWNEDGARRSRESICDALRLGDANASATGTAAAIAGMVGLSFACGAASDLLGARTGTLMDVMARGFQALGPTGYVAAVVAIGIAPGLAEETLFRGWIQGRLAARWGPRAGVVGASFAFGLIHAEPVQGTLAFVAGLYLGWLAERFGSIRPAMAAHSVNNAMFVTLAVLPASAAPSTTTRLTVLGAGATVFAAASWIVAKPLARRAARAGDGA